MAIYEELILATPDQTVGEWLYQGQTDIWTTDMTGFHPGDVVAYECEGFAASYTLEEAKALRDFLSRAIYANDPATKGMDW